MATTDQKIFDALISDTLNIFRLAANEKSISAAKLERLKKRMIAKIIEDDIANSNPKKVNNFISKMDEIIDEEYIQLKLDLDHKELAETVAEASVTAMEAAIGSGALNLPTNDYFNSVASNVLIEGAPSADWWNRQAESTKFAFANQVRQGLANAENNQQIISRIVGKNGLPGIMDIARRNAAALVQTSVQAVANDAMRATFDANDDVIKGLKQVSTLDGKTSLVCVSYSGAEWNLKREPINGNSLSFNGGCPRHFNCRSVEIPITKTFRELGLNIDEAPGTTRASSDGQIDVNTSFDDFLKRKGKAYQDEVLGEGRADLWREGKITMRDLVDGNGRPLTLAQLRNQTGKGFSAAEYAKRYDDPNATPASILAQYPDNTKAKILAVQDKLAKLKPTSEVYAPNGDYSKARLKLHDKILYDGVKGYDPETGGTKFYPGLLSKQIIDKAIPKTGKPTFTVLGGRGGSGKSAFSGLKDGKPKFVEAKVYDVDNVVLFDSDVVKHMLPEFKGFNAQEVHLESSYILERAIAEARIYKANIVLDGTIKSYDGVLDKVTAFREAGYRLEAHYMHLPRQEAAKRAVDRFLGPTRRYVPPEVVLSNIENEANFDKLRKIADDWSFRDNNVARGQPPRLIAKKERDRK